MHPNFAYHLRVRANTLSIPEWFHMFQIDLCLPTKLIEFSNFGPRETFRVSRVVTTMICLVRKPGDESKCELRTCTLRQLLKFFGIHMLGTTLRFRPGDDVSPMPSFYHVGNHYGVCGVCETPHRLRQTARAPSRHKCRMLGPLKPHPWTQHAIELSSHHQLTGVKRLD